MRRNNKRSFLLMALACSAAGVVVGGTASWAEGNSCLQSSAPTMDCLKKDPVSRTVEGMGVGLVAGMGAALGAGWQARPWSK